MSSERHEELAALYVLGLLEGAERQAFEAELATRAEFRTLVDQLRRTSAELAERRAELLRQTDMLARIASDPDRKRAALARSVSHRRVGSAARMRRSSVIVSQYERIIEVAARMEETAGVFA